MRDVIGKAQRFQQWADKEGVGRPDPYQALIADLQALDTPLDPGVVAALATFWKNKDEALKKTRDQHFLFPVLAILLHRFGGRLVLTEKELALADRMAIQMIGDDPVTYQLLLDGKEVDTP